MRVILIDWLVDVTVKFKFSSETLFMTVYIIDQYLNRCSVERSTLQLLGVAALMVASKFNEICCPLVSDLVTLTESTYDSVQIQAMEATLLEHLDYKINAPCPLDFLHRYLR